MAAKIVEKCCECGRSVAPGSGFFVNRVVVEDDGFQQRPYKGDFLCAECEDKIFNNEKEREMITIRAKNERTITIIEDFLKTNGYQVKLGLYGNTERRISADEGELRLLLQRFLDEKGIIKDWLLVNGNTVWSFNRIVKEVHKIKRENSTKKISDYFYKFMHLNFTIAHYSKTGWISVYPSYPDVMEILLKRQNDIPSWHTDLIRIVKYITTQ